MEQRMYVLFGSQMATVKVKLFERISSSLYCNNLYCDHHL
jgi:hypothetical protein